MDKCIGHKIFTTNGDMTMVKILDTMPVQYKDNGEEQWYEICEPSKTDLVMINGITKNEDELSIIIERNEENMNILSDLI